MTKKRPRAWLEKYLLAPDKVLESGDPIATKLFEQYKRVPMPNLALSPEDVSNVLEFMASQEKLAPTPVAKPAAPASSCPRRAPAAAAPAATSSTASVQPIMEQYLRMQAALSGDGMAGVRNAALAVETEAAKLGATAGAIRSASAEFRRVIDVKSGRDAFGRLSHAIIAYAKASGAPLGDGVNVDVLPDAEEVLDPEGREDRQPVLRQVDARMRTRRVGPAGRRPLRDDW